MPASFLDHVTDGIPVPPNPEIAKPNGQTTQPKDLFQSMMGQQTATLQERLAHLTPEETAALMARVTPAMMDSAEVVFLFTFFPAAREVDHPGVLVPTPDGRGTRESIRYYSMPASPDKDTVAFCRFTMESYAHRQPGDNDDDPREIAKFGGARAINTVSAMEVAQGFADVHYSKAVMSEQTGNIGYVMIRGNDLPKEFLRLASGVVPLAALQASDSGFPAGVFEQIMAARSTQLEYVQWVAATCDNWHQSQEGRRITGHHRRMLKWGLGEVEASRHPWFGISTLTSLKNCFLCKGSMAKEATFCPSCNNDLVIKGLEYYELGLEVNDAEVLAKVEKVLARRAEKAVKNKYPDVSYTKGSDQPKHPDLEYTASPVAAQAAMQAVEAKMAAVEAKIAAAVQEQSTRPPTPAEIAKQALKGNSGR